MTNIAEYVYQLVDKNIRLLNLSEYDTDLRIHTEHIEDYARSQPYASKYLNFIKRIYDSVRYVTCAESIKIYNDNADELIALLSANRDVIPIYIITAANTTKSNFYFNLYFLNILRSKGLKIENIYQRTSEILSILDDKPEIIEEKFKGKKLLLIFTDDITYSGSQLNQYMTDYNENVELKLESVKFYLNLIGYSRIAKTKIIKNKIEANIIFPKNAIHAEILNLKELFTQWLTPEIDTIDKLIDANDLYKIRIDKGEIYFDSFFRKINELHNKDENGFLEKSLIYPFFKYPDAKSIIQNFCFVLELSGYIIDLNELKKDPSVRIEKVDDITHENFIYTFVNRHQIIVNEPLKAKIIAITKGTESDIVWLKKLNKVESKPYQGKINLGYLSNQDGTDYKSMNVSGLHLINGCNYGEENIECTKKCTNSFYKKIKYKNIDDLDTGSTQLNIGHLSSIYKKSKNNYSQGRIWPKGGYKFIINNYIRNQLEESTLFSQEEFKFAPLKGLDYNDIFTKKDIIRDIKFVTIISHLKNKYEINDHNNIYQKLIDQIKTNLV